MDPASTTIDLPAFFSLEATALSHGWHECAPMSWCRGGKCLQIIDRQKDRAYRVSVTPGRRRGREVLVVAVDGIDADDTFMALVCDRLRVMLGLDEELSEFYSLCKQHPTLHALPKLGAGRSLRSWSMTENIVKALCATNVNWTQAVKMINRLAQLGPCLPHFRNLNAWPTPREILRAGQSYLLEVCRVGYRCESILTFCQDVCDGKFKPEELDEMAGCSGVDTDTIIKRLRSIHGIGPSSAHFLVSLLGRHDRLSIDSATVAHVAKTHTNGRRPTNKKIEKIYARYGPWKNRIWWYEQWLNWGTAKQIAVGRGVA